MNISQQTKQIIIETDRLVLRSIVLSDAHFMWALLNSDGWLEFIGDRNVKSIEAAEKYLKEKVLIGPRLNGLGMLLVELKHEKLAIGICGLVTREGLDAPDIGFALLPQYFGKGYAYESAVSVLKYTKEKLCLSKAQAITINKNVKSIKLLEKLGMHFKRNIKIPKDEDELMLFELCFEN